MNSVRFGLGCIGFVVMVGLIACEVEEESVPAGDGGARCMETSGPDGEFLILCSEGGSTCVTTFDAAGVGSTHCFGRGGSDSGCITHIDADGNTQTVCENGGGNADAPTPSGDSTGGCQTFEGDSGEQITVCSDGSGGDPATTNGSSGGDTSGGSGGDPATTDGSSGGSTSGGGTANTTDGSSGGACTCTCPCGE